MEDRSIWLALQLCDSAFPGGTLANSQGVESAHQHGLIQRGDTTSLTRFLQLSLEQARHCLLPFVRTAWLLGQQKSQQMMTMSTLPHAFTPSQTHTSAFQYKQYHNLLTYCHALLSNPVARRASLSQGQGFLRVMEESVSDLSQKLLAYLGNKPEEKMFHHAPLFGLVCSLLSIPMPLVDRMFLRMIVRDILSAASRLNLVGPLECSRIQVEAIPILEKLLEDCPGNGHQTIAPKIGDEREETELRFYNDEWPAQTAPIIDLLQSRQDLLYSRLFSS